MNPKWKTRLHEVLKNPPSKKEYKKMVGDSESFCTCYVGETRNTLKLRGFIFGEGEYPLNRDLWHKGMDFYFSISYGQYAQALKVAEEIDNLKNEKEK